jgi:hypothetical protein
MRSTLLAFVTVLSLAGVGCGNNSNSSLDGGNKDLGGGVDLASSRDMASRPKICAELLDCAPGNTSCLSKGSQSAQMLLQTLVECIAAACPSEPDAGYAPCASDQGACTACVMDTQTRMGGSRACIGTDGGVPSNKCGVCYMQLLNCVADCRDDNDCTMNIACSQGSPFCDNGTCNCM